MKDRREFVSVTVDMPTSPKLAGASASVKWAYVTSLCYAGRHLTDGHFPLATVLAEAGVGKTVLRELTERGVWHGADHDCHCDRPKRPGWLIVHDYLEHQRSAADAARQREQARRGASKTNHERWHDEPREDCPWC